MFCPKCGAENDDQSFKCAKCGQIFRSRIVTRSEPRPTTAKDRMIMPVGRSGWAIAAGYAALFGLLVAPAPIALILGLIAAWDLKKNPEKHGWGRTVFALLVGAAGTALLFIVFALGG
ncbi:MAG TPA: hypothetical protein VFZ31_06615 [Vicinamibacterales bacterium]